jgi:hypothetical protein
MGPSESDRDPVEELAEEFVERYRRGERPALAEYTARYPQWADRIRALFPALVVREKVRPDPSDGAGPGAGPRGGEPLRERVGDYRILREVARGGMGIVYEAEQESLGRHVALKVLPSAAVLDPRDLETIVLKATAREPAQRYQAPAELAEDLQRFLDDRPIKARRLGPLHRVWRWCRRNPAVAILAFLVGATLLAGLAAVGVQWHRAERQRLEAEANFRKARAAVDECFTTVTDHPVLQEPGMQPAREVLLRIALRYYQEFLQQRGDDPEVWEDLAQA